MLIAKISCPACGALVDNGTPSGAGNPIQCPACGIAFTMPGSVQPTAVVSSRSRTKKNNTGTIWLISAVSACVILLTAVAAGGFVYYFAIFKNPSKHNDSAANSTSSEEEDSQLGKADPPFDTWTQDLAKAKERAAEEHKDILLLFNASDSSPFCQDMAEKVFSKQAFKKVIEEHYVPLYLDFPQKPSNLGKVADSDQNAALKRAYRVLEFPTLFLTDPGGNPYKHGGYSQESAEAFAARLVDLKHLHAERDTLFNHAEEAKGTAKLKAGVEALNFLATHGLASHYQKQVHEWGVAVRQVDPKNDQGYAEVFFEADWFFDMTPVDLKVPPDFARLARRLDDWKKDNTFKDKNRAARLHYSAGRLAAQAGERNEAMKYALDGMAYRPDSPRLHQDLFTLAGEMGLTCGSGFAVAPDGYLLTNAHVVAGGGKISIRLDGTSQTVPATVVAQDAERDIALVKMELRPGLTLVPLDVDGKRALERGEDVAALGFPLGDLFGTGMKLTTGRVSATPEPGTNNMLLLETKINPGNSGGPICDTHGNVVGMVSAKTNNRANTDSYGLAITGPDLERFLNQRLKSYKPASLKTKVLTWPEVNRKISPSVVMIFRTPG